MRASFTPRGEWAGAEAYDRETLALYKKIYGNAHVDFWRYQKSLVAVLVKEKKFAEGRDGGRRSAWPAPRRMPRTTGSPSARAAGWAKRSWNFTAPTKPSLCY